MTTDAETITHNRSIRSSSAAHVAALVDAGVWFGHAKGTKP